MPNNQRQHRTLHAPKDVLPFRIGAKYCAPCRLVCVARLSAFRERLSFERLFFLRLSFDRDSLSIGQGRHEEAVGRVLVDQHADLDKGGME